MCSHLLADVQDVCDRIAILHQGELKELGRVDSLLKVRDVTEIRARGLSDAAQAEIRAVIERHHGDVLAMDNPTTTLEELFLTIVRDSEARPGRRAKQDTIAVSYGLRLGAASRSRILESNLHSDHGSGNRHPVLFRRGSGPRWLSFLQAGGRAGLAWRWWSAFWWRRFATARSAAATSRYRHAARRACATCCRFRRGASWPWPGWRCRNRSAAACWSASACSC